MPTTPPLPLTDQVPAETRDAWCALLWLTSMGLAAALALSLTGQPPPDSWHHGLLLAAALLSLPMPFVLLENLQTQRQVLAARLAPRQAWVSTLQALRRRLWQTWAWAAVPLALLRVLAQPAPEGLQLALLTAALLAGWLGLVLLLAAALHGLLASGWGMAIGLLLLAAMLGWVPADGFAKLQAAGWPAWAGLALLLPLALRRVEQALRAPVVTAGRTGGPVDPATPWQRLVRRCEAFDRSWPAWDQPAVRSRWVVILAMLIHSAADVGHRELSLLQAWNSSVTAWHVLRLALFTGLALMMLRRTDPHWRELLAPRGPDRRLLGWRIIASTAGGTLVNLLLAAGLVLLGLQLLGDLRWEGLPGRVAAHALPLLVELCFAICLAAWLRGAMGGQMQAVTALAAGATVVFVTLWLIGKGPVFEGGSAAVLWYRGGLHHALTLALAVGFGLLAQRAWARADHGGAPKHRT